MTRVVGQCDGAARAAAAFLRAPFEAHAFCGDERQFAHREHPVQQDQNEDDQYIGHDKQKAYGRAFRAVAGSATMAYGGIMA
ncbi:hypothetical protein GCM10009094_29440 [Massilia aurea]